MESEKNIKDEGSVTYEPAGEELSSAQGGPIKHTKRDLRPRHVQIMAISGAIGTGLFIGSGQSLAKAGPVGMVLAYAIYSVIVWSTFNAMGEMVCYLPVDGSFIHLSARYIDPSFAFGLGWLYTYNSAVIVAAEVAAVAGIINFWNDTINNAVWCAIVIAVIAGLNLIGVRFYGEGEFYLSLWKIFLILGLIAFTFITMVGGNPQHDAYGFRYWKTPGPFAEYIGTGVAGHFAGFWSVFVQAAYAFGGPDYISLAAGEAKAPRRVLPNVFNRVIYRLITFYVLGILCVSVSIASDDPALGQALPGAGSSPFVLAAVRLQIPVLPDIINAVLLTSAWSCGLEIAFASSRSLYGLAMSGCAPGIFRRTWRGVPIFCVLVVTGVASLSFMTVSNSSSEVFSWIVNIVGSGNLLIFGLFHIVYIRWHRATIRQGMDRSRLPFKQRGQIYMSYASLVAYTIIYATNGFPTFVEFNYRDFIFAYVSLAAFVLPYIGHKLYTRKSFKPIPLDEVDFTTGVAEIEALADDEPPVGTTMLDKFNRWLWG